MIFRKARYYHLVMSAQILIHGKFMVLNLKLIEVSKLIIALLSIYLIEKDLLTLRSV